MSYQIEARTEKAKASPTIEERKISKMQVRRQKWIAVLTSNGPEIVKICRTVHLVKSRSFGDYSASPL